MSNSILLQGGTLLIHDEQNHVIPTVGDLLVTQSIISKIGPEIQPPPGSKVIDCKGKIISPGFIDTHRHMWQTQLKGSHANQTLIEYMPRGNAVSTLYSTDDLFYGQLAGALESIDAGTTTVVDHASCNSSPDHPQAAIQALLSAGLRTVYCVAPLRRIASKDPFMVEEDAYAEESLSIFQGLALAGPFGDGRVHIGYCVDNLWAPAEVIKPFYASLRDASKGKAKLITSHAVGGPMFGAAPSAIQMLNSHGLLGQDILLSHANYPKEGDGGLYKTSGAHVSCTPNTELQMGSFPVALLEDHYDSASLGVDCHSWGVSGIPGQMRLLLQGARAERGDRLVRKGKWTRRTGFSAESVFNLGTLGGAKATGLQNEVGSLKEGLKADIVIFDGTSPSMLAAAAEDPVAAIIFHSNPSDISFVLVDGIIRKENGKLTDVVAAAAPVESRSTITPGTKFAWDDIVAKVLESRKSIKEKMGGLGFDKSEDATIDAFYMDRKALLEEMS